MGHEEDPWQGTKVWYEDIRSMSHFVLLFSLNILFRLHGNLRPGVVGAYTPQTVSWILIWTHRVSPWSGSCTHNYIRHILAATVHTRLNKSSEFPLTAPDQGWHSLHLRCWNSTWFLSGWNADISVPQSPASGKLAKAVSINPLVLRGMSACRHVASSTEALGWKATSSGCGVVRARGLLCSESVMDGQCEISTRRASFSKHIVKTFHIVPQLLGLVL